MKLTTQPTFEVPPLPANAGELVEQYLADVRSYNEGNEEFSIKRSTSLVVRNPYQTFAVFGAFAYDMLEGKFWDEYHPESTSEHWAAVPVIIDGSAILVDDGHRNEIVHWLWLSKRSNRGWFLNAIQCGYIYAEEVAMTNIEIAANIEGEIENGQLVYGGK